MKRYLYISQVSLLLVFLMNACVKPEACIEGPTEVVVGETATWIACGEGKVFEWNVHDGLNSYSGEGQSFSLTFDEPTQNGNLYLHVEGSALRGEDDASFQFSVKNIGYKVRVVDENYYQGLSNIEGVANAEVALYTSKTCWDNETQSDVCLVASGTTDAEGYVFLNDVTPGTYIVDATGNEVLANWSDNIRNLELQLTEDQLYYNSNLQVQLGYNGNYLLSKSNKWLLTDVRANDVSFWSSVSDCSKDNFLKFNKDLTWTYEEGGTACPEDGSSNGTYNSASIAAYPDINGVSIDAQTNSGPFKINSLSYIDKNTIEVYYYYYDQGSGQSTTFVYTFTGQ